MKQSIAAVAPAVVMLLAAGFVALLAGAGCSATRAAVPAWEERDAMMVAEVVVTAERPAMAVAEVVVEAAGPMLVIETVEVTAKRLPVEVTDFGTSRDFVN